MVINFEDAEMVSHHVCHIKENEVKEVYYSNKDGKLVRTAGPVQIKITKLKSQQNALLFMLRNEQKKCEIDNSSKYLELHN